MKAFVAACGRWVEVPVEEVRKAVKAGAVFETLIAPVIKDCVWGEIEWRDGVLTGSEKGVAEQYLIRHFGGVEEAWLIVYTDDEYAERAVREAERRGFRIDCKAPTGGGP